MHSSLLKRPTNWGCVLGTGIRPSYLKSAQDFTMAMRYRCTGPAALLVLGLLSMHATLGFGQALERTTLEPGYGLGPNDELALSGVYRFVMQEDCNLVLYHTDVGPLWASETDGKGTGCHLDFQTDGNAVIHTGDGQFVWHTNTCCRNDNEHLIVLQSDGNCVMYNNAGKSIWATDTKGR